MHVATVLRCISWAGDARGKVRPNVSSNETDSLDTMERYRPSDQLFSRSNKDHLLTLTLHGRMCKAISIHFYKMATGGVVKCDNFIIYRFYLYIFEFERIDPEPL